MTRPFDNVKENVCKYCKLDGKSYKCSALASLNEHLKMEEESAFGEEYCTTLHFSVCGAVQAFQTVQHIIDHQDYERGIENKNQRFPFFKRNRSKE